RASSTSARRSTSSNTSVPRRTRRPRSPSNTPAFPYRIFVAMKLKTLMGDHAVTTAFKTRGDKFDFVEVKGSAAPLFKRVVRNHEFDLAEMAIMTYVIAKAFDTPYRLLPFVVMARFQHPHLVFNADKHASLTPKDLIGKRVGVRAYSVTTGAWVRYI